MSVKEDKSSLALKVVIQAFIDYAKWLTETCEKYKITLTEEEA